MEAQQPLSSYTNPPTFSAPLKQPRSVDVSKPDIMEVEYTTDRSQRGTSVLSGLSADDLEAAETLKSLGQDVHSPRLRQAPPTHIQTRTTFNPNEPEPVLSLITSQYPLAASIINGSISVYKTAQKFTPGGEWTETHIGLPLARKTARISGVENVARWALQPKKDARNGQSSLLDIEKGYLELTPEGVLRQSETISGELLPAYEDGDRSPPYSEELMVSKQQQQAGPSFGHRLVITTSGLGIAMNEESIRSLKYCLSWLRWANSKLSDCTSSVQDLLKQWERRSSQSSQPMSPASLTADETNDNALAARIAEVKSEVLATLKQVMNVVSTYAGGALPENARRLVHQHLVSLPQRFSIASRRSSNEENDAPTNNATQALLLAQQGLEIFGQVFRVLNDTLVSAEDWCEKLGRRKRQPVPQPPSIMEKGESRERSETVQADADVKMEM